MKICVVITTFNRLDKLKIALSKYEEQTESPKYIIVVNNNSNDGTKEYLETWQKEKSKIKKEVINLDKNTGGSGGFYTGLKESLKLDADWVWVSDDDAFPKNDCFEIANKYIKNTNSEDISALCGTIVNRGKIDLMHRRRVKKGLCIIKQFTVKKHEYKKESFELDMFSYVGTLINKEKMEQVGLTNKDYFIYFDDSEHSYRLSLVGKIICIPKMVINHDGPVSTLSNGVNWKYFYLIRNTLDFVKKHFSSRYYNNYCKYIKLKNYIITTVFYKNKKEGYKLINSAIEASKQDKLGLNDKYKPGWKVGK